MDFQNEFDSATDTINDIVSTQLSSALTWSNVQGTLTKASSSSGGYVWGYNSTNLVFVCALPCSGNWTEVDVAQYNVETIQDLTTDSTNVYILATTTSGTTILLIGPISNQGSWLNLTMPFPAVNIFSTNTYLWAQDKSNNKQKCAKPCTTNNWLASPENKVTITSSSASTLYGKDGLGNAMKTDENLQSGWSSISGLSGMKLQTVIGQADQRALFAIDTSSHAFRCDNDCSDPKEIDPLDTQGYMPINITADAASNSLWMTSTNPGDKGNIFTKLDTANYTSILNLTNPLDQKRTGIVNDVKDEYSKQTQSMIANKQVTDVVNFFTKMFKFDKGSVDQTAKETERLKKQVEETQQDIDQMSSTQPIIQKLLLVLVAVAVIYAFGSFIGTFVHTLALLVLVGGVVFVIYYS
jgi:hypothetical protein